MSDEFPSPKTNFLELSSQWAIVNDKERWKIMKNVLIWRESIANEKLLFIAV